MSRSCFRRKRLALTTLVILVLTVASGAGALSSPAAAPPLRSVMLFYLNGDNDLGPEVLHSLDLLETVGSSAHLRILALVDGHDAHLGPYDAQWQGTRLVEVRQDHEIGVIRSPVLAEFGELDLGAADTLEAFVRYGCRVEADRYYFAIFAHGRGVIDTQVFRASAAEDHKPLALSSDATSHSQLNLSAFQGALKRGLGGKRFQAMVFLTCLANMVEIAYELADVTDYIVASPDEIRLVNQPPGRYQIRGIPFEHMLVTLTRQPHTDTASLGREMVDAYIEPYLAPVEILSKGGALRTRSYSASLALIDCRTLGTLTRRLDHLAALLTERLTSGSAADDWRQVVDQVRLNVRRYPSFLNLEYYDLVDLMAHLAHQTKDPQVHEACRLTLDHLQRETIVYERHTTEAPSSGLGIYFSHRSVPENIFSAHQAQYRQTRFSRDTRWDELVDALRERAGS